jgi:hypothetical protein
MFQPVVKADDNENEGDKIHKKLDGGEARWTAVQLSVRDDKLKTDAEHRVPTGSRYFDPNVFTAPFGKPRKPTASQIRSTHRQSSLS